MAAEQSKHIQENGVKKRVFLQCGTFQSVLANALVLRNDHRNEPQHQTIRDTLHHFVTTALPGDVRNDVMNMLAAENIDIINARTICGHFNIAISTFEDIHNLLRSNQLQPREDGTIEIITYNGRYLLVKAMNGVFHSLVPSPPYHNIAIAPWDTLNFDEMARTSDVLNRLQQVIRILQNHQQEMWDQANYRQGEIVANNLHQYTLGYVGDRRFLADCVLHNTYNAWFVRVADITRWMRKIFANNGDWEKVVIHRVTETNTWYSRTDKDEQKNQMRVGADIFVRFNVLLPRGIEKLAILSQLIRIKANVRFIKGMQLETALQLWSGLVTSRRVTLQFPNVVGALLVIDEHVMGEHGLHPFFDDGNGAPLPPLGGFPLLPPQQNNHEHDGQVDNDFVFQGDGGDVAPQHAHLLREPLVEIPPQPFRQSFPFLPNATIAEVKRIVVCEGYARDADDVSVRAVVNGNRGNDLATTIHLNGLNVFDHGVNYLEITILPPQPPNAKNAPKGSVGIEEGKDDSENDDFEKDDGNEKEGKRGREGGGGKGRGQRKNARTTGITMLGGQVTLTTENGTVLFIQANNNNVDSSKTPLMYQESDIVDELEHIHIDDSVVKQHTVHLLGSEALIIVDGGDTVFHVRSIPVTSETPQKKSTAEEANVDDVARKMDAVSIAQEKSREEQFNDLIASSKTQAVGTWSQFSDFVGLTEGYARAEAEKGFPEVEQIVAIWKEEKEERAKKAGGNNNKNKSALKSVSGDDDEQTDNETRSKSTQHQSGEEAYGKLLEKRVGTIPIKDTKSFQDLSGLHKNDVQKLADIYFPYAKELMEIWEKHPQRLKGKADGSVSTLTK